MNCRLLNQIYTNYGSFFDDLHRFEHKDAPNCVCGEVGTPKHHFTTCPLTEPLHLVQITTDNMQLWHNKLANNKHVRNKGKAVIR